MKSSTCNISHVRNKTNARPAISRRFWSHAQRLLREYRITLEQVGDHVDLCKSTVHRCLNFQHFYRCELINITRVRAAVETLLLENGWPEDGRGNEPNLVELWDDYNKQLDELC